MEFYTIANNIVLALIEKGEINTPEKSAEAINYIVEKLEDRIKS